MSNSNFHALPTEILANVFDRLLLQDLRECEVVCQAWYPPAHRSLLRIFTTQIGLTMGTMELFMKYNPSTLNQLKQLQLGRQRCRYRIDPACARELFKRLQNLEQLDIVEQGILDDIVNDDGHVIIAKSCPYLKKVAIRPHVFPNIKYHHLLNELRNSLTYICLSRDATMLRDLFSFPCLEEIDISASEQYFTLQGWLTLFNQNFTLKSITGYIRNEPDNNFTNQFMESKTEEEQNLIINKLSKLETLHIENEHYHSSTIQFINQYFTGLKYVHYYASMHAWDNVDQVSLYEELLDYICNIQAYNVEPPAMSKASLSSCLPLVLNKGFQQIPSNLQCVQRTLQVYAGDITLSEVSSRYSISMASTKLNDYQIMRFVKLEMPTDRTLIQILTDAITTNSIDTFKIDHGYFTDPATNYTFMIRQILDKLQMVKRVTIVVPYSEKPVPKKFKKQYPQVTHLRLDMFRVFDDTVAYDAILHMFPNIKYLKLYAIMRDTVDVPYKLEVLYLDVTSLVRFNLNEEEYTKVLLIVDLLSKDEQHFHSIPVGKLITTSIDKEEACNMEKEDSTLTFRVRIPDVQLLVLYLCRRRRLQNNYMDDCPEEIVEAKLSFK